MIRSPLSVAFTWAARRSALQRNLRRRSPPPAVRTLHKDKDRTFQPEEIARIDVRFGTAGFRHGVFAIERPLNFVGARMSLAYTVSVACLDGAAMLARAMPNFRPGPSHKPAPVIWLIGAAYCFWNMAFWGFLGWMPSYLAIERHIDITSAGMLGGVPYLFALVGVVLTGWLGSGPFYRHRPKLLAATYLLSGVSLYVAYSADNLTSSLVGLSSAAFFIYAGLATYGMVVLDLAPTKTRAVYSGIVSTIGQLGSIAAPMIIGYLVSETGMFTSGFIFMIVALCIASACALALAPFSLARRAGIGTVTALDRGVIRYIYQPRFSSIGVRKLMMRSTMMDLLLLCRPYSATRRSI